MIPWKIWLPILLLTVFSSLSLSVSAESADGSAIEYDPDGFEGTVSYRVLNDGVRWDYVFQQKGSRWRSELWQGKNLYEVRIGNKETGEAFLVNDGGKSYSPIGRFARGMRTGSGANPNAQSSKKKEQVDLSKVVLGKVDARTLVEIDANLDIVKGKGAKLDVWTTASLGSYPAIALPRFKLTQEKQAELMAYFEQGKLFPLALEERGKADSKGFHMVAETIEYNEVDAALVSIPDDYEMNLARPGGVGKRGAGGGRQGGPGGGRPPR